MENDQWTRDTLKKLESMPPAALLEGVRLAAQAMIQGSHFSRPVELTAGLCLLEICNRYELSVLRESN